MHGPKSCQKSSAPSRQAKLEKDLAPLVWREWHHVKQPDQERRDPHTCIVTPTFCWRSQSPSAVNLVGRAITQRFRNSDNDMHQRGWVSTPTPLTDVLPTCNLVANVQGCTGRNRAESSSAHPRQTTLDIEQPETAFQHCSAHRDTYRVERAGTLTNHIK